MQHSRYHKFHRTALDRTLHTSSIEHQNPNQHLPIEHLNPSYQSLDRSPKPHPPIARSNPQEQPISYPISHSTQHRSITINHPSLPSIEHQIIVLPLPTRTPKSPLASLDRSQKSNITFARIRGHKRAHPFHPIYCHIISPQTFHRFLTWPLLLLTVLLSKHSVN
jgi:hypothetical protein